MIGARLKSLRKGAGYTQVDLASRLDLDKSSIAKYESAGVNPSPDILLRMSELFNVSVDYLLGKDAAPDSPKGVKIPVLGRVQAGIPIEAIEEIIDWEEISQEMAATGDFFGLSVCGNSMEPKISDGDVVIVRKQPDVDSGDIAVVLVNGDFATVKRVVKRDNGLMLVALNRDYEPMFYTNDEVEQLPITILGRVMELRAKF